MKSQLRKVVFRLLRPFVVRSKDFVDQRLHDTEDRIVDRVDRAVTARWGSESILEVLAHLGQRLRQLSEETRHQGARIHALEKAISANDPDGIERDAAPSLERLRESTADVLNFSESHLGFRAQAGLWFNDPIALRYRAGQVEISGINERILEIPYVFAALASLPYGAELLDVGGGESTVSLSLASLGYRVTQIDLRPQVLRHPNLTSVESPIEEWNSSLSRFDAIICLSSIEHFGLGAYGEELRVHDADLKAMKLLWTLGKPGSRLVLTAPFGRFEVGPTQRTYDWAALTRVLRGWNVDDLRIGTRLKDAGWAIVGGREHAAEWSDSERPGVVLVSATRSLEWPSSDD